MTKKQIAALIGLAVFTLGTALASAQDPSTTLGEGGMKAAAMQCQIVEPPAGMAGCCGGCSLAGNLTEDQKKKIDEWKAVLEKEMIPLKSKVDVKTAELRDLLIADKPDAKAVDKKIEEIGAILLDMAKKKIQNRLKIREALTPEQRTGFDRQTLGGFEPFGGPAEFPGIRHRRFMRMMQGPIGPGIRHPMMEHCERMRLQELKEMQEKKEIQETK
jgi:Spy/CpxP family protein refolding chaperone